jgi:F-box protein 45
MSSASGNSKEKDGKLSSKLAPQQQKQRPETSTSKDMRPVFAFGNKTPSIKQPPVGKQRTASAGKPSGAIVDENVAGNESLSDSEQSVTSLSILDLPDNVTEHLFTFLSMSDLKNCALVCKQWNAVLGDENNEVWRASCYRRLSREVIHCELLSSCPTYKSKIRAFFHAWNPHDCSRNVYVKPSGFTIHRNPVAQSTDGARGKIGFSRGRHSWEIVWEGPLGTVAVVGIATKQAEMRAQGYVALLGQDEHSWGWNLVENYLLHNGDSQGNYPLLSNAPRYQVGEKIRVILDCEDNTLSFEKNFEFLGVAFRGLPKQELYPSISAVYGNTEVSMVYLGPPLDG